MFYTATISLLGRLAGVGMHPDKTIQTLQEHQEGGWGGGEKARKHRQSFSLIGDKRRIKWSNVRE